LDQNLCLIDHKARMGLVYVEIYVGTLHVLEK
jgi:hypothetical protein